MRIEALILNVLVSSDSYAKRVIPHIKPEYFSNRSEKAFYGLVTDFYTKYNRLPPKDVISLTLDASSGLSADDHSSAKKIMTDAYDDEYKYDMEWLLNETETFCKDKSVYNAIMKAVKIINGEDKLLSENQIPSMMQEALSVSFDKDIGHDYFEGAEKRYEFYHSAEVKIKTSIDLINKVTDNGLPRRTLNLLIGPSGSGKSAVKCSLAADYLEQGYNVLYITMELAEMRVAERIDANRFNVNVSDIKNIPKGTFLGRIEKIQEKTRGSLVIKEYPTGTASAADFRILLDELKNKKGFVPDVILVDYLGICASSRYKNAANVNTYNYQTAVAEELRALAVEYDLLMWSSVQTNRSGMNVSDYDIEAIADSTGPYKTCDTLFAIIRTDDLNVLKQMILKQLKNRFGDLNYFKKFIVGMDFAKMKMYNVENSAHLTETHKEMKDDESKQDSKQKPAWDFD